MPVGDQCWMYDWIDEFDFRSDRDVEKGMESPAVLERLHELAKADASSTTELTRNEDWTDLTLVAGEGFNLSGRTNCGMHECQKQELTN